MEKHLRELPFPQHRHIYHLSVTADPPSSKSFLLMMQTDAGSKK
jgi:hypothetical protein